MKPGYYIIGLLLCCGGFLFGKQPEEDIEVITGEWVETGNVKKLYDTPLGAVYRFSLSSTYLCQPYSSDLVVKYRGKINYKKESSSGGSQQEGVKFSGVLQFNFGKKRLKDKRFVVIDFKVRAFPAVEKKETADFQFQLLRSGEEKLHDRYKTVNGILDLHNRKLPWFSTSFRQLSDFWKTETSGYYYTPLFEPYSYRIIFDTRTGKNLTVNNNGLKMIITKPEELIDSRSPIEIKTFGIVAQSFGSKYRRQVLEFSPPKVYRFNSAELLDALPELTVKAYPYAGYALRDSRNRPAAAEDEFRQVKRNNNPDLQYAYALRLLYGDNAQPSQAIELLERAAKEDHVLANYQLGVCYYRGYAVEMDYRKADRYLKIAENYGYTPATILRMLLIWNQKNRPRFAYKKPWAEKMKRMFMYNPSFCHAHDPHAYRGIFTGVGDLSEREISPKSFARGDWAAKYLHLKEVFTDARERTLKELDELIQSGYRPGALQLAMFLQWNRASDFEIAAALKRGVDMGDRETEIMYLEWQARLKKLDASAFTLLKQLQFGFYPQYLLLEFAMKNPDFPGVAEFLQFKNDHAEAKRIWQATDKPEARYLLGLLEWTVAFPYWNMHGVIPVQIEEESIEDGKDSRPVTELDRQRRYEMRSIPADVGFKYLKEAAKQGVPNAMYLIARQYSLADFPIGDTIDDEERSKIEGHLLMKRAAEAGQLNARFELLKTVVEDSTTSINKIPQYLPEVEEFIKLDYSPAYLVKARILDKMGRKDAPEAYLRAARKGEREAWRLLALKAAAQKQMKIADEFWSDYIRADREFRQQDRYDVFYPEIKIDIKEKPWQKLLDERAKIWESSLKPEKIFED
ncbi:MAG: hypothetical protein LBM70_02470 [Victivallales bacterium]|jgi:TPR repeat protein|nr:hypothetical protein [Victivallales bacterium]